MIYNSRRQGNLFDGGMILKQARIGRYIKQKDIAKKLGVSAGYISRIESGQDLPSKKCLVGMIEAYGLLSTPGFIPTSDMIAILKR